MDSGGVLVDGVPEPETVIGGKYRIIGPIGRGGMGCLVAAEHLLLRKNVAIKLLLADQGSSARQRLFREARAAQALTSDHVVRVFDLGVHDDVPYIVMELLEGADLAQRVVAEGPLDVEEAVDTIIEACVAVAEAHMHGIVHRDLKPANLFASHGPSGPVVKVLDFGISKVPDTSSDDCQKTAENTLLGTPQYTSPEQLRNPTKIDGRADVWSLAVTLFHLLTGGHPFEGSTTGEITGAIFTDAPRDPRTLRSDLPEVLCQTLEAALAKRPEERTASVQDLVEALVAFASARGRRAAARVLALAPGAIPSRPPARPAVDEGLPTTADGMASTLHEDANEDVSSVAPRARPSRWPRIAALAVLAAGALMVARWTEAPGTEMLGAAVPSVVPTGAPTTARASEIAPVVPVPAAVDPPHPRRDDAREDPQRSPPPPRPATTPSLPATPAKARPEQPPLVPAQTEPTSTPRDIDGVPIVD